MTQENYNQIIDHVIWLRLMGLYETRYIMYWWYGDGVCLDAHQVDELYDIRVKIFDFTRWVAKQ